jgi:predicted O-linked N-acetylglucosamine transferase (SPINDLY family)
MLARLLSAFRRHGKAASTPVAGAAPAPEPEPESKRAAAARLVLEGHAAEADKRFDEAEHLYRAAIAADDRSADAHMNLGNALNAREHRVAAIASYERALALDPDHAAAHYNLGLVLLGNADPEKVVAHFRAAVRRRGTFADAWIGLALALEAQRDLEGAVESYRKALSIRPQFPEALRSLGLIYQEQGKTEEAMQSFLRAVAIAPDYADVHGSLGVLYKEQGKVGAAIESYRKALAIRPAHAEVMGDLGNVLQEQGDLDSAIEMYRKALALKPGHVGGHGNLLFALNYHPDKSAEDIFEAYRAYDARFGVPLRAGWREHANDRDPARRLRVGYVSPDFNHHPVRHFLEPLLAHHDKSVVEVHAYSESTREDAVTARYRGYVEHWLLTRGMSDEMLTDRLRTDRIDILVDLAGHTAHNRLGVFARRPAPVSVSWLGYGYTTGLQAIDYFLTDATGAPEGSEHLFAERPWRLATPGYVYRPAEGMGPVGLLPAARHGRVTFGTLTRSVRINHRSIRVWSEILKRVPRARLVVDSKNFLDAGMRASLVERFAAHDVGPDRLQLGFHSPPWDVLRQFDIGLDCFPHNSGTTLFETLWMGVPFVTLAGRPSVGRLGSSILEGLGHPEWIAHSEAEYVEKAVALATDVERLAILRASLRDEMSASPLMDEAGFARKVEAAYREMFAEWAGKAARGSDVRVPVVSERASDSPSGPR